MTIPLALAVEGPTLEIEWTRVGCDGSHAPRGGGQNKTSRQTGKKIPHMSLGAIGAWRSPPVRRAAPGRRPKQNSRQNCPATREASPPLHIVISSLAPSPPAFRR
eukprot:scaffold23708_cov62-Isochrysis_galbana.AAC.1